jgi:hypothetical protein
MTLRLTRVVGSRVRAALPRGCALSREEISTISVSAKMIFDFRLLPRAKSTPDGAQRNRRISTYTRKHGKRVMPNGGADCRALNHPRRTPS